MMSNAFVLIGFSLMLSHEPQWFGYGLGIATVTLARGAYRLGEIVEDWFYARRVDRSVSTEVTHDR